jgi:hypothetical protein
VERGRRKKWLIVAAIGIIAAGLWWQRLQVLNPSERTLLGRWCNAGSADGPSEMLWLTEFYSDWTARVGLFDARTGSPLWEKARSACWRVADHEFVLDWEPRSAARLFRSAPLRRFGIRPRSAERFRVVSITDDLFVIAQGGKEMEQRRYTGSLRLPVETYAAEE